MIKVSVIIPIYNCEEYLDQCVRSVLCQTIRDLEVICINDGSTDNSAMIVERLQKEDTRIILFHQENQGAGAARNLGIKKARGKYVAFLDADDYYLDPNALELMFHECEIKGISICASLRKFIEDGNVGTMELFQDTIKNTVLKYEDFQLDYEYQSFLFLREHLIGNKIFFPHYRRFQDPPFLVKALYMASEFTVADTYLYCYRVPNVNARFNAKRVKDLLCGLIDNLLFAQKHNLEILFKNTLNRLEYEYESIICKNIGVNDTKALILLVQINQIVHQYYGRKNYIVRPLRRLIYGRMLLNIAEKSDKIVLYGAGKCGKIFLTYLQKHGFLSKVKSFVVSVLKENEVYVRGIPVYQLHDEEAFIFVTVGEKLQGEIKQFLDEKGYKNYKVVKAEFLYFLENE